MWYADSAIDTYNNWCEYLNEYRSERNFNEKQWVEKKINTFNEYLGKHNLSGAV